MFPPLSLLAGKYLTEIREAGHVSKSLIGFHLFFALTTAIAISLAPLTPAGGAAIKYGIPLFMILSALFSVHMLSKGRMRGFLCSQACLILLFVTSVWGLFAAPVSSLFTSKAIAETLSETEKAPELPVYIDTFYRPSVAFYTGIYGKALPEFDEGKRREAAKNEADGVLLPGKDNALTLPDHAYILVQKKIYDHWPEKLKAEARLLWEKDTAVFLVRHAEP